MSGGPSWAVRRLQGLVFLFVLLLGLGSVHSSDTWTHLATGGWIAGHRALPSADPFSAMSGNAPWRAHDWLADAAFFLAHSAWGPWGLIALKAATVALAFALLVPLGAADPLLASGVLALGACAAWPGLVELPAAADFLFVALLLRWLGSRRPYSGGLLWRVAAASVLWANLHPAGAWIGVGLCGVAAFRSSLGAPRGQKLGWLGVAAVPLLALLTNPHAAGAWGAETLFRPEWSLGPELNLYALYLAGGAVAAWVCLQEDFILSVSAMLLAALSIIRPSAAPLYPLAAAPVITLGLGHFLERREPNRRKTAGLALLLALLGLSYAVNVTLSRGPARGYSSGRTAEGAVEFLEVNRILGKMFNDLGTSPELLWRAASARPLFADKRPGVIEPGLLEDAARWSERWPVLASTYRFDYAVLENDPGGYPAKALDEDPGWRLAYFDDSTLVYLRKGGPNDTVIKRGGFRRLKPNRWLDPADEASFADAQGRREALEETTRALTYASGSVAAVLVRAYVLQRLGESQEAEGLRELARSRGYWRPEHWLLDGSVLERKGDWRAAVKSYARGAMLAQRSREPLIASMADARLAALWGANGDLRRARRLARKAIALDPGNTEAQDLLRKL